MFLHLESLLSAPNIDIDVLRDSHKIKINARILKAKHNIWYGIVEAGREWHTYWFPLLRMLNGWKIVMVHVGP